MRVVGIDPAPTKGLDAFDGRDHRVPLPEALTFISAVRSTDDVLICWDAPLTGPTRSVVAGGTPSHSTFFQRPIERFFSRSHSGFKTPPGISVLGYAGCSHWAISRAFLGLPRVGPYDAHESALPFKFLDTDAPPQSGPCVVEVHPAVAIWLWCRDSRDSTASWQYKGDPSLVRELWRLLVAIRDVGEVLSSVANQVPTSDDQLDARVAYALGRLWLESPGRVILLGDADHGTFLLPQVKNLREAFADFVSRLTHEWSRRANMSPATQSQRRAAHS